MEEINKEKKQAASPAVTEDPETGLVITEERQEAENMSLEEASGQPAAFAAPLDTLEELAACVEAVLFSMGEAVELDTMAKALEKTPIEIRKALDLLEKRYSAPVSGIMIQYFDNAVQLSTKTEQYGNLIRIAKVPKKLSLSESVLETLSIIAYKQPITKVEVEQIRGVSSDYAINRLLEYDLIRELGRKDAPGRPILFGTTEQFLRSFGVHSLGELPSLNAVKTEEFREEAEAEVREKLGV